MTQPIWIQILEPGHPSRIETISEEIEVGRDCDGLIVDDPTVSRRHIRLEPSDDGLVVHDLESANGTFIEGERITEPWVLPTGNRLRIGETEIVVHEGRATEAGSAPEGQAGAQVVGEASRISAEARRLNAKSARKGTNRPPR